MIARRAAPVLAFLLTLASGPAARACAVCFGNDRSADQPMVEGAVAGGFFLIGVIGVVLAMIVGFTCFFAMRARRLEMRETVDEEEAEAGEDHGWSPPRHVSD